MISSLNNSINNSPINEYASNDKSEVHYSQSSDKVSHSPSDSLIKIPVNDSSTEINYTNYNQKNRLPEISNSTKIYEPDNTSQIIVKGETRIRKEPKSTKLLYYDDSCSCGNSKCKKKRRHIKNRKNKCSDNCNKKDCKYCKIFESSPHHLGTQILVSNEIEANRSNIKELYIDGCLVSKNRVKEQKTLRFICDNTLTNRKILLNNSNYITTLDDLIYSSNQSLPKGGLLKSICINDKDIGEIIYNPTFQNKNNTDSQIEISILVVKIEKRTINNIKYVNYQKLSKAFGVVNNNRKNTLNIIWKGPFSNEYLDVNFDTYLWFMVDSSEENSLIDIVSDDIPDITMIYAIRDPPEGK